MMLEEMIANIFSISTTFILLWTSIALKILAFID